MKQINSVSIIIPVYNEAAYLPACLEAIAQQTVKPYEVIVVDNNSTDNSVAIARSYPFVKVLREKRQGVVYARDRGFNAARGDIIGRIDADTILPPQWVARVGQHMEDATVTAITGPVGYYDMPWVQSSSWLDHHIRNYLYTMAPDVPFMFGSNCALRRTAWKKIKADVCRGDTVHEDLDLALHLTAAQGFILYSRSVEAAVSARRYDDHLMAFYGYMRMYLRTYTDHGVVSPFPRVAVVFYWLGYVFLRSFRSLYDEKLRRMSLSALFVTKSPRKNPATSR